MAAPSGVCPEAYRDILRTARRFARSDDEARDLVQDVLVIALARGVDDWSSPERQGWLRGVVRRRAAFVVRGQQRRRRREQLPDGAIGASAGAWAWTEAFLASLAPSLRAVALLASADLCAAEIRWLLELSDTALRQRLSALRRAVRAEAESPTLAAPAAQSSFGARRAQLLSDLRRQDARAVVTHDPDGHVLFLRMRPHGTGAGGNVELKEQPCPNPT